MKVISYNVNGIRAALKKGFLDWLSAADPDVLCLQETKAQKEQLDLSLFRDAGYEHQYWYSAQKKGYSGVAVLSKKNPNNVAYGTKIESMDHEGRNLRLDFDNFSVMSLYLPSGTNDARLDFKLQYMAEFQDYVNELKKEIPNLLICGDYNICHEAIDIHNPVQNKNTSGFLPVEREWIGKFIDSGFVDTFRHFSQEPEKYTWWDYKTRARSRNVGWRLDYFFVSEALLPRLKNAFIMSEIMGSDHCPVGITID